MTRKVIVGRAEPRDNLGTFESANEEGGLHALSPGSCKKEIVARYGWPSRNNWTQLR